ncbi:MAG: flagellar basal body P-ring protein FlgI [Planctomycetota bacterium]
MTPLATSLLLALQFPVPGAPPQDLPPPGGGKVEMTVPQDQGPASAPAPVAVGPHPGPDPRHRPHRGRPREQLEGVGLVMGLQGTGDGNPAARIALTNFLNRFDLPVRSSDVASGNYALVRVACRLPVFPKNGQRMDVSIASIGDTSSLRGGRLLTTTLKDPFGREVLAVAEGALIVGGFQAQGKNAQVAQNHTTTAVIPGGAILEPAVKELQPRLLNDEQELVLGTDEHNESTYVRMARVINEELLLPEGRGVARVSPKGVRITLDPAYRSDEEVVRLLDRVWQLEIEVDSRSKIVIDETTSTVIIGADVVIEPCIVNAGSLTIQISEDEYVSQPGYGWNQGTSEKVNRTRIDVQVDQTGPKAFGGGGSLKDLLLALKSLGTTGPEMINVIRAMKRAGKIHADLDTL